MSDSVYTTRKKVTLKDGTIKEYTSKYKYQKKKAVVHKPILQLVKTINDPEKLKRIEQFIQNIDGEQNANDIL